MTASLLFIFVSIYCALRLVKTEPAAMIVVVVGWVCAVLVLFGVVHFPGGAG